MRLHKEWQEDALELHKFYRQVDDTQAWMREREPLIGNITIGNIDFSSKVKAQHSDLVTYAPIPVIFFLFYLF